MSETLRHEVPEATDLTPRLPLEALPALLAGLLWLSLGFGSGLLGFLLCLLPGLLLVGTGVTALLISGDLRIHHYMALGSVIGALFGIVAIFAVGPLMGLALIGMSAWSGACGGRLSAGRTPLFEDVPTSPKSWRRAAEVAGDDAILATMGLTMVVPDADEQSTIVSEVREAAQQFRERGVLDEPDRFHPEPPPLTTVETKALRSAGLDLQHLSFESEYEPAWGEPGRDRWLSYAPNRRAHGWLLEHDEPNRPWLLVIHGYQMGSPQVDLQAFRAAELHHQLGMNVLLPVLPLHGPRQIGRRSGDGFLSGNVLDSIHGVSQAVWDMRRMLSWIRAKGAETIGVHGLSLGGYHTATLASLDSGLACAIPGIPATDMSRLVWKHGPPALIRRMEEQGLSPAAVREVMRVACPLDMTPKVPASGRYIFGATHDQLVPADQVRDLWEHWERPRIEWYPGGHLSFGLHANVRSLLRDAYRESGLST